MTAAPEDRAFATFRRGALRDLWLRAFRNRLRLLTNPSTGAPFTEIEITIATARLSRWANHAEALDLLLLASQGRALVLADQLDPLTSNTEFLRGPWCRAVGVTPREAAGGSGIVDVTATPGSTFVGSTTLPDPTATVCTDEAGLRYQVLYTAAADVDGNAAIEIVGLDTGDATNLEAGSKLFPSNGPIGWAEPGIVRSKFRGGVPADSDAVLARRIAWHRRNKPGAGNPADVRGWGEDASASVEVVFVYACALGAGSILVAVVQERGTIEGPLGRVPSVGTLAAVRARLTPPGSADMPAHPYVLTTGVTPSPVDMVARLGMPVGAVTGWTDLQPWPATNDDGDPATIATVTSQVLFRITLGTGAAALPTGVTQPRMMAWNATRSRFEELIVSSVVYVSGTSYDVTLAIAPSFTLAVGAYICPDTKQRDAIGLTAEAFFDTLGTGEVVPMTSSLVGTRAARFPEASDEYPQRAGTGILTMLDDVLGSALGDRDLPFTSLEVPAVPSDPASGPALLVAGRIGVYALDA